MGGSVFVAEGGTLTISGSGTLAGTVVAGTGAAFGGGIFCQGIDGGASTLSVGSGNETISSSVADYIGSGGTNPNGGMDVADQGGSLALAKTGTGTLTLSAANTYTGARTVGGGTLALSGAGSIQSSALVSLTASGAVFDISGASQGEAIDKLGGVAGTLADLGSKTLTINVQAGTIDTFSGAIQDGWTAGGSAAA